jgi:hypothetical protein
VKKLVLLATTALVAMLILVPTAIAQGSDSDVVQESTTMTESTMMMDEDLPKSGGPSPSVLLPASALVLGSGILAYGILRRR